MTSNACSKRRAAACAVALNAVALNVALYALALCLWLVPAGSPQAATLK
ncbi:hypothetical protein BH11PSE9_BH11PSE9_02720 [soil metagenome]